jgi:hypothetical protein
MTDPPQATAPSLEELQDARMAADSQHEQHANRPTKASKTLSY